MRFITKTEINKWDNSNAFENLGNHIYNQFNSRHVSLDECIKSMLDEYGNWSAINLQISNRIYTQILRSNYERGLEWNSLARIFRDLCEQLVATKLAIQPISTRLAVEALKPSIANSLSLILLELEYSDITPPLLHPLYTPIFLSGNLPCGWEGKLLDTHWAGASSEPLPSGVWLYH